MPEPDDFSVFDLGFKIPGPPEIGEPLTRVSADLAGLQETIKNGIEQPLRQAAQTSVDLTREKDVAISGQIADVLKHCQSLTDTVERALCFKLAGLQEIVATLPQIESPQSPTSSAPPYEPWEVVIPAPSQPTYPDRPVPPKKEPYPPRPQPPYPPRPIPGVPEGMPQPGRPVPQEPQEPLPWGPGENPDEPRRQEPEKREPMFDPFPKREIPEPTATVPSPTYPFGPTGRFNPFGNQEPIITPNGRYTINHPETGEPPLRSGDLYDVDNAYWVPAHVAYAGMSAVTGIPPEQQQPGQQEPATSGPPLPTMGSGFLGGAAMLNQEQSNLQQIAKAVCESKGGKWTYDQKSGSYICCGGQAGVQDPACGGNVAGGNQCCCCNTQHNPDESCPPGSVRKDGKCVTPQGDDVPPIQGYGTFYDAQQQSCQTVPLGGDRPRPNGELVGYGKTAAESQFMAGAVCRPKVMPVDVPAPSGSISSANLQCGTGLYYNISPSGSGFQQMATIGLQNFLNLPGIKAWLAQNPAGLNPGDIFAAGSAKMGVYALDGILKGMQKWGVELIKGTGCVAPQFLGAASALTGMGFLEKYLGGPWEYVETPLQYIMRGACPLYFPSAADARAAWLANRIPDNIFRNWAEINGHCWEPFAKVTEAMVSKPIPSELIQLVRRGIISEEQYQAGMRQLGYVDAEYRNWLRRLGEQLPFVSDLTSFMVRDVADEELVARFGMDADFGKKFTGKVAEWSHAQGVTADHMRAIWRAHWHIPSPTQLFEFYHRLTRLPEGNPARITIDDVKAALQQQDILPFWIDKYLAVSYRRLTRVDVRRAFDTGSIDRHRVRNFYQDLGYTLDDSELMTKFAERQKLLRGFRHQSVMQYVNGIATTDDLKQDLRDDGYEEADINRIVDRARKRFKRKVNAKCQAAIHRRYWTGELTIEAARGELLKIGYDGEQAGMMVDAWHCELQARGKELNASTLASLFERGIIDANEFVHRLEALGYDTADAAKIVSDVSQRLQLKITREQAKRARAQQAELEKQAREAAKTAAEIERREAAGRKASEAAAKAKKYRDRALIVAAEKYAKCIGVQLPDAFDMLLANYNRLRSQWKFSPDDSVQAVVLAVEKCPFGDEITLEARVDDIAGMMLTPSTADQNGMSAGSESRNGSTRPSLPT